MVFISRLSLVALAFCPSLASAAPSPLDADDECAAGGAEGCALSALQRRARGGTALSSSEALGAESGCHTALPGEACYNEIMWAKTDGLINHPEWYVASGLTPDSSDAAVQAFVHVGQPGKCARPCGIVKPKAWCLEGAAAPTLWAPAAGTGPTQIKILTYNLFWWNLFTAKGGNGNSAGHLIKDNTEPKAFDVMGFQECEDLKRVFEPVGLLDDYEAFQGEHAICMAYNKKAWALIKNGTVNVGEDMPTKYYGRRGAQWMRLRHLQTGQKLFFANHHGPLSVNSGGVCGGEATAFNILQVMATEAEVGDALVLVGDFNANAASLTIQTLWMNLVQVFAGKSFGGVDNIFSNVDFTDVVETKIMGSGGSDHDAIYATVQIGEVELASMLKEVQPQPPKAASELTGAAKPGHDWQEFWCGQIEDATEYIMTEGVWNKSLTGEAAYDPEHCCRECQAIGEQCQSFVWKDFSEKVQGRECLLSGNGQPTKKAMDGFVSGLAYTASAALAMRSAQGAKQSFRALAAPAALGGRPADMR